MVLFILVQVYHIYNLVLHDRLLYTVQRTKDKILCILGLETKYVEICLQKEKQFCHLLAVQHPKLEGRDSDAVV